MSSNDISSVEKYSPEDIKNHREVYETAVCVRLFRLVKKVQNPALQDFLFDVLARIPLETWIFPSSYSHHMPDERGYLGNLIHTERVVRIAEIIANCRELEEPALSELIVEAILHDSAKHGLDCSDNKINHNHPILVEKYCTDNGIEVPGGMAVHTRIFEVIARHMGRWGYDKEKSPDVPRFVPLVLNNVAILHLADAIAAHMPEFTDISSIVNIKDSMS